MSDTNPLRNIIQVSCQEINQIAWVIDQYVRQAPRNQDLPGGRYFWTKLGAKITNAFNLLSSTKSGQALITPETALIAIRHDENLACAKLVCPRCAAGESIGWTREGQACHADQITSSPVICRATKLHERLRVEMAK